MKYRKPQQHVAGSASININLNMNTITYINLFLCENKYKLQNINKNINRDIRYK